jgi:hypothetical protein
MSHTRRENSGHIYPRNASQGAKTQNKEEEAKAMKARKLQFVDSVDI